MTIDALFIFYNSNLYGMVIIKGILKGGRIILERIWPLWNKDIESENKIRNLESKH